MTSNSFAAPELSIVLPVYNAAGHVGDALHAIARFVKTARRSSEVIVVDDGSTDDTARAVDAQRDFFVDLRLLRCDRHRGDGYAARLGMKIARGTERVWIDAGADLAAIAGIDDSTLSDVVIARPDLIVAAQARGWTRVVDAVRAGAARRLISPDDARANAGLRWFRAEAADALFGRSRQNGRALDSELLALARNLGLRTTDLPVHAPGTPHVPKLHDAFRLRRLSTPNR